MKGALASSHVHESLEPLTMMMGTTTPPATPTSRVARKPARPAMVMVLTTRAPTCAHFQR